MSIRESAVKAFNDTFHKVRAEVSLDWWLRIWEKADSHYKARYETLREVYREEHPRITNEAIDAFIDGKIAGEGVGAGPEPSSDQS